MLIFFLSFFAFSFGQSPATITGRVTAPEVDSAVNAVSVQVENGGGTMTDDQGAFSIRATLPARIVFSRVGYKTQTVVVTKESNITVHLESFDQSLNQVVVIGYGTQKKGDLTSAISVVPAKKLEGMPVQTTESLLQGQAAGMTVTAMAASLAIMAKYGSGE